MKIVRIAVATVVGWLFAGVANAVPIRFDFAGTVTNTSNDRVHLLNQSVSGFLTVETDGLVRLRWLDPFSTLDFASQPAAPGPSLFSANLTVGGEFLPTSGVFNYGRVRFFDACSPDCLPGYIESFGFNINSRDRPFDDVPEGRYYDTGFALYSMAYDPETGQQTNYYDITPDFDVTSILTLPLLNIGGLYQDVIRDCVAGECNSTFSFVQFNFTSVTRSSASVPEPGSFGLLGAALAGMFFMRRRRLALSPLHAAR